MSDADLTTPRACEDCGLRLLFSARYYRHRWCVYHAAKRGISQIGCPLDQHISQAALSLPVWWRWTIGLHYAIQIEDAYRDRQRIA